MELTFKTERERQYDCDVCVIGGGTAGFVAALASARTGAKTILIEKNGFIGGTAINGATGLHSYFNIYKPFPGVSKLQLVRGIPQEMVDELVKAGGSTGHVEMEKGYDFVSILTPVDPEVFKMVALKMCTKEPNLTLMLHTSVITSILKEEGIIDGVVINSKSGLEFIKAKIFIDCSGDGDVAAKGGAKFRHIKGNEEGAYGVGLTFRIGNVNLEEFVDFLEEEKILTQLAKGVKPGDSKKSIIRIRASFSEKFKGEDVPRDFFGTSIRPNELTHVNCIGFGPLDALSKDDLTKAEIVLREKAQDTLNWLKANIPGFSNSFVSGTSLSVGVRRTRAIECLYNLTREDVLEGRSFSDEIGRFGFIDNPNYFVKNGGSYGIPYRCLIPLGVKNCLVAGRMISLDFVVHNTTRNTACCMVQGQAAGTAAALSILENTEPSRLPIKLLQEKLTEDGVYFEG